MTGTKKGVHCPAQVWRAPCHPPSHAIEWCMHAHLEENPLPL